MSNLFLVWVRERERERKRVGFIYKCRLYIIESNIQNFNYFQKKKRKEKKIGLLLNLGL